MGPKTKLINYIREICDRRRAANPAMAADTNRSRVPSDAVRVNIFWKGTNWREYLNQVLGKKEDSPLVFPSRDLARGKGGNPSTFHFLIFFFNSPSISPRHFKIFGKKNYLVVYHFSCHFFILFHSNKSTLHFGRRTDQIGEFFFL